MRKITSIVLSLIMIFTMAFTMTVSADITPVPATDVRVNVAQGKTVTTNFSIASSSTGLAAYGKGERLTDGYFMNNETTNAMKNNGLFWSMCPHDGNGNINDTKTPGKPYFDIDLGRRYPIEEVVIFGTKASESIHRGKFKIVGSDYADFSQSEVLFYSYVNEESDQSMTVAGQSFPRGGKLSITLSEKPVYRYIRYAAEVEGRYDFTEFQVFSTFKATEISRNANVTKTDKYPVARGAIDNLVDGAIENGNDNIYVLQGYSGSGSDYANFTVDLASAKHVGLVEIYANDYASVGTTYIRPHTDGRFQIYGIKADGTEELIEDFPYNSHDYAGVTVPYGAVETPSRKPYRGPFGFTLNGETEYKAIKYKKNTNASQAIDSTIALNEFRAYEVNPEVYTPVLTSAREIKLPFSDFNMDEATITTNNIILYDGDGSVVTGYTVELADNGADVIITSPVDLTPNYTVKVTTAVRNTYGVAVAAETVVGFPLTINTIAPTVYELEDYIGYEGFKTSGGSNGTYLKAGGASADPDMEIELEVADTGYYNIEALMHNKANVASCSKITMTLLDKEGNEIAAFDNVDSANKTAYGYADLGVPVYKYTPDTVYLNKGTVTLNVDVELAKVDNQDRYRFIMDYVKFSKADYVIEGIGDVEETEDGENSTETKKASISIKTNDTASKDIMVAIALYDITGNMISATSQTKNVTGEVVTFDPAATCEAEKAKTTKVFIWEANDLTPLR